MPENELDETPVWETYSPKKESDNFFFPEEHHDYQLMRFLHDAILRHAGGFEKFRRDVPRLLRQAIDEVIDAARSRRYTIGEIEKTEKTYLGTKVEILLRHYLGVERGEILDLSIDGVEVDVKNTVRIAWTIPNEALGHPCILISANELTSLCSFGIIVIRADILNAGRNRDQKTTITKNGLKNVHWLLKDFPYPANFWQHLPPAHRDAITKPRGGTERTAMLFRLYQRQPVPRGLVEALAQQKDYMKRLRKNGGARDLLCNEGTAILSGKKHRILIAELGLPQCGPSEFISITPTSELERAKLVEAGEIRSV
jgi:hypothetical protein